MQELIDALLRFDSAEVNTYLKLLKISLPSIFELGKHNESYDKTYFKHQSNLINIEKHMKALCFIILDIKKKRKALIGLLISIGKHIQALTDLINCSGTLWAVLQECDI